MLNAAVVGATGIVGQQFLVSLLGHPWFRVSGLAASGRSAGKSYAEALQDDAGALRWYCEEQLPEEWANLQVQDAEKLNAADYDVIFTGVESDSALLLEPHFAKTTPVISTASAFRNEEDVPLLIPGINSDHAKLIAHQRSRRGWKGFVAPIPNCTVTGLAVTLKPLLDEFGLKAVLMTSLQALSGAGRSPGVRALDIIDNVIPFIPKEEEKVMHEGRKILGTVGAKGIRAASVKISCTCMRVNVKDGHTESVFVSTEKPCLPGEVKEAMDSFASVLDKSGLPSAPERMIVLQEDPYRPQPRRDRDTHGGMATVVGRIREDEAMKNGIKYVLVSHNTKMGAAKGAVLTAEMLVKENYI